MYSKYECILSLFLLVTPSSTARDPSILAPTPTGIIDQSLYVLRAEMDGWYTMLPQCLAVGFAGGIGDTCTNGMSALWMMEPLIASD